MTFDEIDARRRAAVLTADAEGAEWDDPENADEQETYDESGDQGEDA